MRYKQLVTNDIEKAEQLCFSLISSIGTNVISREKTLQMLNQLKGFIESVKDKVNLEPETR